MKNMTELYNKIAIAINPVRQLLVVEDVLKEVMEAQRDMQTLLAERDQLKSEIETLGIVDGLATDRATLAQELEALKAAAQKQKDEADKDFQAQSKVYAEQLAAMRKDIETLTTKKTTLTKAMATQQAVTDAKLKELDATLATKLQEINAAVEKAEADAADRVASAADAEKRLATAQKALDALKAKL